MGGPIELEDFLSGKFAGKAMSDNQEQRYIHMSYTVEGEVLGHYLFDRKKGYEIGEIYNHSEQYLKPVIDFLNTPTPPDNRELVEEIKNQLELAVEMRKHGPDCENCNIKQIWMPLLERCLSVLSTNNAGDNDGDD